MTLAEDVSAASVCLVRDTGSDKVVLVKNLITAHISLASLQNSTATTGLFLPDCPVASILNQANVIRPLSCVPKCLCLSWLNKSTLLLPFSEWHLSPKTFSFKIKILVFD